jgi:hypothetical protein
MAWQWKFTSLNPLEAGQDVSEPVDRAPLALYDRPEPSTSGAAIREVPTAKQLWQLGCANPWSVVAMEHGLNIVLADLSRQLDN